MTKTRMVLIQKNKMETSVQDICIAFGLVNSANSSNASLKASCESESNPFVDVVLDYDEHKLLSGLMGIHQTPVGVVNPDLEAYKNSSALFKIHHAKHVKPSKVHSLVDIQQVANEAGVMATRTGSCSLKI